MLTLKTLRGAGWSVATRLSSRAIDLATLLVLARVLTPADFGLTAIAGSFISIVDMVLEIPLVQALMRLQRVEKAHLDTAFTVGLLRSAVIAVLMAAAAWPVAHFYHDNRLLPVILAFALGPMARSLYSPAMVQFYRDIDFRVSFIADFSSKVIASFVSFLALYAGAGYWTLVIGPIVSSIISTILSYVIAPYRPGWSMEKLSDFSSFTGWFTASQVVAAFSWQYDRVFLGYHVDKSVVGRYGVASDFSVLPTQSIIGPAMRPVMAAFATISEDHQRLQIAFLKAARLTMLIALPAGIGIALTADQIVNLVLGAQWSPAAVYLRWLSLAIMFTAYYQPVSSLCVALDNPKVLLEISIIESTVRILLLTAGFYLGGVVFMIYFRVIAAIFGMIVSGFYAKKLISVNIYTQVMNLWRIGLSCFIMAGSVVALHGALEHIDIGLIEILAAMIICGGCVYSASMHLLGFRLRALRL